MAPGGPGFGRKNGRSGESGRCGGLAVRSFRCDFSLGYAPVSGRDFPARGFFWFALRFFSLRKEKFPLLLQMMLAGLFQSASGGCAFGVRALL